uniref:ACB domain-containing protein n=1 Tax=Suricata suricatta TaxID=37032 RepID=A0A673UPQ7_SURSU
MAATPAAVRPPLPREAVSAAQPPLHNGLFREAGQWAARLRPRPQSQSGLRVVSLRPPAAPRARAVLTNRSAAPRQPGPRRPLPARGLQPANRKDTGPASVPSTCQVAFEMACAAIKQLKGPVSDEQKLLVYSFYKQATQDDCNIPAHLPQM